MTQSIFGKPLVCPKLMGEGYLVYRLSLDGNGVLQIEILANCMDASSPGKFTLGPQSVDLIFAAIKKKASSNANDIGFWGAILKDLELGKDG